MVKSGKWSLLVEKSLIVLEAVVARGERWTCCKSSRRPRQPRAAVPCDIAQLRLSSIRPEKEQQWDHPA